MKIIQAVGKKVVLKPIPLPSQSGGGIMFAPQWQQKETEGIVQHVGWRCKHVKPGDRVAFSWINGVEVETDEGLVKVIDEDEITAILEEREPAAA